MTTVKTKELPAKVPSQLDTDLTLMGLHFMAEHTTLILPTVPYVIA